MAYESRDPRALRRKGAMKISIGIGLFALGIVGLALLAAGDVPEVSRASGYPFLAAIAGLGMMALGVSDLREAIAAQREAQRLREKRAARRQPTGA